jgi:hypothetical protein
LSFVLPGRASLPSDAREFEKTMTLPSAAKSEHSMMVPPAATYCPDARPTTR